MKMQPFLIRAGTQDLLAYHEILTENEYDLPDAFTEEDVIVDIGAHIGTFATACLQRGCGKVVCYEPEEGNYAVLEENLKVWGPRAVTWRRAVWRNEGVIALHTVYPYSAMHHTLHGLRIQGDCEHLTQAVPAVRLEDILREQGRVRLLKLDCEGAEKPILDDTRQMDQVQEVVGELHYKYREQGGQCPTPEWLYGTLTRLRFPYMRIQAGRDPGMIGTFWGWRETHEHLQLHQ